MAIVGKTWTAVLYRALVTDVAEAPFTTADFKTLLVYNDDRTTPAQIASYYPSLSWDSATGVSGQDLRNQWLPQQGGFGGVPLYASDEAAILDMVNFNVELNSQGEQRVTGVAYSFFIRWIPPGWTTFFAGAFYAGTPDTVSAQYPDANTYNDTTAAPFGTALGNGLIRHQALYYRYGANYVSGALNAWPYPDTPPDPAIDSGIIGVTAVDTTYIFTPVDDGIGGSVNDGEGDGATPTDGLTIRCWAFSLDGHDFYVLRIGDAGTLVYDLTTGSWAEWETPGRTNWRAHVGQNWIGTTDFSFYDTDVFAGDDASGTIWRLGIDEGGRDQRSDMSLRTDDKISHVVMGGIQVTGRDVIPCNVVTLDVALGDPTQTGASIQLEISDDLGQTWIDCGSQTVVAGDFSAVIEWRGLGLIKAPGRLFRFTDDGATVRFGGANLR